MSNSDVLFHGGAPCINKYLKRCVNNYIKSKNIVKLLIIKDKLNLARVVLIIMYQYFKSTHHNREQGQLIWHF